MAISIILNDPSNGSERSYNGLCLAKALGGKQAEITPFLMTDALVCTNRGQKTSAVVYNRVLIPNSVIRKCEVLPCATCMYTRGINTEALTSGVRRRMKGLAESTLTADRVLLL
ncbi:MAG: DsrE family protein [Candidatus Thiodiazotropha sp.]